MQWHFSSSPPSPRWEPVQSQGRLCHQVRAPHLVKTPKGGRRSSDLLLLSLASLGAAALGAEGDLATYEDRFSAQQDKAKERPVEGRPTYIGCTESAEIRETVCKALLRTWPGGPVDEFWSVVGGLSGLDSVSSLLRARIGIGRVVLFDVDPLQVEVGRLMVALLLECPTREDYVKALFGRSMESWGRLLTASSMLDFLDLPEDVNARKEIQEALPPELQNVYSTIFSCVAQRRGWPLVWPSFGHRDRLPSNRLSTARRRLGGGRNEAFHINEAGWLKDEKSYALVREAFSEKPPELLLMNLEEVPSRVLAQSRAVLFISNIEGSPQFMKSDTLNTVREALRRRSGVQGGESGTLLVSTQRAEWIPTT